MGGRGCYDEYMANELALERQDDILARIFTAFYSKNLPLLKAIEQSGKSKSWFYSIPEEDRIFAAKKAREELEAARVEEEEALEASRLQALIDVRREGVSAWLESVKVLRELMSDKNVAPFVREKAAVDLMTHVERNFKDETLAVKQQPDETHVVQLPAPSVVVVPILPMPGTLNPVTQLSVPAPDGSWQVVKAKDIVEGETVSTSSSSAK